MNDIKTIEELRAYHERLKAVLEALTELQNRPSSNPQLMSKYERDRRCCRCGVGLRRPNRNYSAVGGKRNAIATVITRRFAVDVSDLLSPSTCNAIPCVNTNVTGAGAVAGVMISPNSNGGAVGGKRNATAAPIIRRFAVDVSALLFPSTCGAIPCVNTNVTGAIAVAVVMIRPNSNYSAVGGK